MKFNDYKMLFRHVGVIKSSLFLQEAREKYDETYRQGENYRNTELCLLLATYIDSIDGPLIHDFSKEEQNSFDSTCRKFYKRLVENALAKIHNKIIHRTVYSPCRFLHWAHHERYLRIPCPDSFEL